MQNEIPINGQGLRLVQQSEGKDVPLLQPWEVEGERELIKHPSSMMKALDMIESRIKRLFDHTQTCKDPACQTKEGFDAIMDFRRRYLLSLLKENNIAMYEVIYAVLALYISASGNEPLFVKSVLVGLTVSASLISDSK